MWHVLFKLIVLRLTNTGDIGYLYVIQRELIHIVLLSGDIKCGHPLGVLGGDGF
ncbi:hypothetical protein ALT721_1570007 [Alteromonas alvinellae]